MNSSTKRPGLLFTLVGPAGAGKNRLMKHVLALKTLPVRQLPTATTRAIRPGEQEGREHLFVSPEAFQRMIETNRLLEHEIIHGNLYGMPRAAVEAALDSGEAIIADVGMRGAGRAREAYPENVVSIFIQPPSIGTLIERMRERRETEIEIGKRLLRVPPELAYACECKYGIVNDVFEQAAEKLYQIMAAELQGDAQKPHGDPLIVYNFVYEAQIIPVYHDEALRRNQTPHDVTTALSGDELPHQTALRSLQTALQIVPSEVALIPGGKPDGDYLPPVALEYTNQSRERIRYVYLYRLDQRIPAPAGWSWTPIEALPETLRTAVLESER